jgi:hypothetical protein
MHKFITDRNLIIINLIIISYFVLIFLLNYYDINYVLFNVFRELLTLPFMAAQIFFLYIGIKHIIINPSNLITITSSIALTICTIITIGSFF